MSYYVHGSELTDPYVFEALKKKSIGGYTLNGKEVEEEKKKAKYPEYLGSFKLEDEGKYNSFENPHGAKNDKGHLGSPDFRHLFPSSAKFSSFDLSPNFGTEINGIQLSQLDDNGKNDLALYLEKRGLVVFRNQDLKDKGPGFSKKFGEYFGPLHIHPVSYSAEDYPELLVTYRKAGGPERYDAQFQERTSGTAWHSDISFERYPASFSFFVALEAPDSGGDTVFIDTREAYRRLSPPFRKFLETLTVIHTNYYQNKGAQLNNLPAKIKKDYFTEHPLVRTHPVTGEKSLFFSRSFIQKVKGFKKSESDAILNFLEQHVLSNPEIQVRATHRGTDSGTVIAWDNRIVLHTAILDFLQHYTSARHHYRITVLGEKPYISNSEEEDSSDGRSNGQSSGHSNGHSNGQSSKYLNGNSNGHSNGHSNGSSNGI